MPYFILAFGILMGIYGLYKFLTNATVQQISTLVLAFISLILIITLTYMALTGKLAAALTFLIALWPFGYGLYKQIRNPSIPHHKQTTRRASDMSAEEALDILGLKKDASDKDIEAAYKKLMKKVHPDQDGSHGLAEKLNQARDTLIKYKKGN